MTQVSVGALVLPEPVTCATCGQEITGSHYHCSCGTPDTTGQYGHHTRFCRVSGRWVEEFHHCGPGSDCNLLAVRNATD